MKNSIKTDTRHRGGSEKVKQIDFQAIKAAAQNHTLAILYRYFPDGKIRGKEFLASNPKRSDKTLGSFSININSGVWADFSTGDKGGDLISLTAYLFDLSQLEAAKRLANIVGVEA